MRILELGWWRIEQTQMIKFMHADDMTILAKLKNCHLGEVN